MVKMWGICENHSARDSDLLLPEEDCTVEARGGELSDLGTRDGVRADASDGVLVLGLDSGLEGAAVGGTLGGLVLEHVEGSTSGSGGLGGTSSLLLIDGLDKLPLARAFLGNEIRSAVETGDDDPGLVKEEAVAHGEELQLDGADIRLASGLRRSVSDGHSGVVADEAETVAAGAESDTLDPAVAVDLNKRLVESLARTPVGRSRTAADTTDGAVEDASLVVSAGSGKEAAVGVPRNLGDSAAVALDVLGDPPVVVLLEVAHRDNLRTAADGELGLIRRPAHPSGCTVDTKDNENRVPLLLGTVVGPHIGVTILRAGHKTVALGRPVNASDNTVVLAESVENLALLVNDQNIVVVGAQRTLGAVTVPGVAGDALSLSNTLHGSLLYVQI